MNRIHQTKVLVSTILLVMISTVAISDEAPENTNNTSPGVVNKVEKAVEKGAKATGRGVTRAAEATARGVKRGANAVARSVEHGVKAVGHAVERTEKKMGVSQSSSQDTDNSKQ